MTEWILELDNGHGIPWKGNYSTWLEAKQDKLRSKEKRESARQRLQEELDWIRQSPKGRQTKSKARVRAFEALLSDQTEDLHSRLELRIPPGPRLGDVVYEAKDIRKGFGERLLVDDLSFLMPPGAIVGIIDRMERARRRQPRC